jgi:hypothetical protein
MHENKLVCHFRFFSFPQMGFFVAFEIFYIVIILNQNVDFLFLHLGMDEIFKTICT